MAIVICSSVSDAGVDSSSVGNSLITSTYRMETTTDVDFLVAAVLKLMDALLVTEGEIERVFIGVHVYLIQSYHEVLCRLRIVVHNIRGLTG